MNIQIILRCLSHPIILWCGGSAHLPPTHPIPLHAIRTGAAIQQLAALPSSNMMEFRPGRASVLALSRGCPQLLGSLLHAPLCRAQPLHNQARQLVSVRCFSEGGDGDGNQGGVAGRLWQ